MFPDRFLKKVSENNTCWEWLGCISTNGYGKFFIKKVLGKPQIEYAHRFSFMKANELESIPRHLDVMHSCDNKKCVNPDHLSLGTRKQNSKDAVSRGLIPIGDKHHASGIKNKHSKLTEDQIRQIRFRVANGELRTTISNEFGIDRSTVCNIVNKKIWGWLD